MEDIRMESVIMVAITCREVDITGMCKREDTYNVGPFRRDPVEDTWDQGPSREASHWLAGRGYLRVRAHDAWVKPVDHGFGLTLSDGFEGKACDSPGLVFKSARVIEIEMR